MPFSADDLEVLKGMFETSNNSVVGLVNKMDNFVEQQAQNAKALAEHLTRLTDDMVQVKDDIANMRLEYDRKLRDLNGKLDLASASASTASTAGDATPSWPSSKKTKFTRTEPAMETAMAEGGNMNRVWIFGFKRDFYSSYFLKMGADLLNKAGIDDIIIKQCKVRAFNMKARFSIDFPSVGIARDFVRLVNAMGFVAEDRSDSTGQHPTLRAAQDRSKEDREKITYMTKAWKVVHDSLADNKGWDKGMTLRSTGTDGVLFIENPEKTDGYRIVRFNFGMTVGTAMPTMDMNFDVLSRQFGLENVDIEAMKDKIRASWL